MSEDKTNYVIRNDKKIISIQGMISVICGRLEKNGEEIKKQYEDVSREGIIKSLIDNSVSEAPRLIELGDKLIKAFEEEGIIINKKVYVPEPEKKNEIEEIKEDIRMMMKRTRFMIGPKKLLFFNGLRYKYRIYKEIANDNDFWDSLKKEFSINDIEND